MKILFLSLIILCLFSCNRYNSDDHIKDLKVYFNNIDSSGIMIVLKEDVPPKVDHFFFEENDNIVKKIRNDNLKKGDTLLIKYPLKDSTDYTLYGSTEAFTDTDNIYYISHKFWYSSKGDTLNYNPEYDKSKADTVSKSKGEDPQLLTEIKNNEHSVKDVTITTAGVLYIAVEDDGTFRNGLAEYFCQLASDYNSTVNVVKIVKFGSMNDPNRDNAYGVLLGGAKEDLKISEIKIPLKLLREFKFPFSLLYDAE